MSKLTVIIPAAGKGSRLGLPYPKEIMRISASHSLIDYSFDFFRDHGRRDVEFVIVINEHKTDVVKYLSRYNDRFNISFTFQNPYEHEYTGAIKSARHLFGEHNVILLPDTIMKLRDGVNLYESVMQAVTETGFAFFYAQETREQMLRTKGALHINDHGCVDLYEDKPEENLDRFNAYWTSFAFRRRAFDSSMNFMEKSTLKQRIDTELIKETPIWGSRGIEVESYRDLGTWSEIMRHSNGS